MGLAKFNNISNDLRVDKQKKNKKYQTCSYVRHCTLFNFIGKNRRNQKRKVNTLHLKGREIYSYKEK